MICVYGGGGVVWCICQHTCVWRPGKDINVPFLSFPILFLWNRIAHWTQSQSQQSQQCFDIYLTQFWGSKCTEYTWCTVVYWRFKFKSTLGSKSSLSPTEPSSLPICFSLKWTGKQEVPPHVCTCACVSCVCMCCMCVWVGLQALKRRFSSRVLNNPFTGVA